MTAATEHASETKHMEGGSQDSSWDQQTVLQTYRPSDATIALLTQYEALLPSLRSNDDTHTTTHKDLSPSAPTASDATGIRERILQAYQSALACYPYRCIERMRFSEPRMLLHPFYEDVLKDLVANKGVLLDFGCCMGTDLRKLCLDGMGPSQLLGVDINRTFVDAGMDVVFGDRDVWEGRMFVTDLLTEEAWVEDADAKALVERIKEAGGVDVMYAGSVMHLFDEDGTRRVAETAHKLLMLMPKTSNGRRVHPKRFLGRTCGSADPNEPYQRTMDRGASHKPQLKFLHSKQTLTKMLEEVGFTDVRIRVGEGDMRGERERDENYAFFDFTADLSC